MSEYLHSLLLDAQKKEEDAHLEALLLEGLSGVGDVPLTSEFWKELKKEAGDIATKHKALKQS